MSKKCTILDKKCKILSSKSIIIHNKDYENIRLSLQPDIFHKFVNVKIFSPNKHKLVYTSMLNKNEKKMKSGEQTYFKVFYDNFKIIQLKSKRRNYTSLNKNKIFKLRAL